jgi:hypothetical protein
LSAVIDAALFERWRIGADLSDRLWGVVFPGLARS